MVRNALAFHRSEPADDPFPIEPDPPEPLPRPGEPVPREFVAPWNHHL